MLECLVLLFFCNLWVCGCDTGWLIQTGNGIEMPTEASGRPDFATVAGNWLCAYTKLQQQLTGNSIILLGCWMDRQIDGWTDRWMDRQMDGFRSVRCEVLLDVFTGKRNSFLMTVLADVASTDRIRGFVFLWRRRRHRRHEWSRSNYPKLAKGARFIYYEWWT